MSMIYPYDPDGNMQTNLVNGTLSKSTFPNIHNVLVPLEAPFFRNDFRLMKGDVTLIEGIDYYLVYYYKKAAEGINKAVYGGVLPISDFDDVTYRLRTLGGSHMVPYTELGRYLNNPELKDPRSTDWSELQRYPVEVAPIDPPSNFQEAFDQDVIIRSLVSIKDAVVLSSEERDVAFKELFDEIQRTENYYNVNFLELHDNAEHKHKYDAEMVGALRKEATAVDALKAYGYTLSQMVDQAKEHGMSMYRINQLVESNLGLMFGSLVNINDNGVSITTDSNDIGKVNISLKNDDVSISLGNHQTTFDGAKGGWFGAGINAIIVPSVVGVEERPILNGYYILIPSDVDRYLFSQESGALSVTTENTDTVRLFGDGTENNPIYGRITLPTASKSNTGLGFVVGSWGGNSSNAVVSQKLISQTIGELETGGFASIELKINGNVFNGDQELIVSVKDIGLDLVDNTAVKDKPVTDAILKALENKESAEHKHDPTDLDNVSLATFEKAGLGVVGPGGFLAADLAEEFIENSESTSELLLNSVPGWASSGAYYGDNSYLPAPVNGNYGHVGYSNANIHGEWESDNRFVFVDIGNDTFGFNAYYHIIDFNDDSTFKKYRPTATVYNPSFLGGAKVNAIWSGKDGVFFLRDDQNRVWLVLSKGTMDQNHHEGYWIDWPYTNAAKPILIDGVVYIVTYSADNFQPQFKIDKIEVSKLTVGLNSTESVVLGGKNIFGSNISSSSLIQFAPVGISTNANDQTRVIREDNNHWSSVNFSHSARNFDIAQQDSKIRIFGFHRPYCSNTTTATTAGTLTTSIEIDVKTNTFVIADPDSMKVKLTTSGFTQTDSKNTNRFPLIDPNRTAFRYVGTRNCVSISSYDNVKLVYVASKSKDLTAWDLCGRERLDSDANGVQFNVTGATATLVKGVAPVAGFLDDETFYCGTTTTGICKVKIDRNNPYPGFTGFGPTQNHVQLDYDNLGRIPRKTDNHQMEGYIGSFGQNCPTRADAEGRVYDRVTFATDSALLAKLRSLVKSTVDSIGTEIDYRVQLSVFGPLSAPDAVFVYYMSRIRQSSGADLCRMFLFSVSSVTVANSVVSVPTNATLSLLLNSNLAGNVTGINDTHGNGGQSIYGKCGTSTVYYIGQGGLVSYVGNSLYPVFRIVKTAGGVFSAALSGAYSYNADSYISHHKDLGYLRLAMSGAKDAYRGTKLIDSDSGFLNLTTTGSSHIIFAVRAAESWQIYFTEEYPIYNNGSTQIAPICDFDLRDMFPNNYTNRTFYIHVHSDDRSAWYTIDEQRLLDDDQHLNIGYVVTDDERIIDMQVENVRRYGDVGALLRHNANLEVHDGMLFSGNEDSVYGELKNQGVVDSFSLPTFKDIYDTWYRFSHSVASPDKYPSHSSETNNWSYDSSTDTVNCTINSASYIGFISNDFTGDYVFNTVITSNDSDNDLVSVVVAALKQGDIDNREHTLSVTIDQTLNEEHVYPGSNICLWDNSNQHDRKIIHKLNPNRFSRGWSNSYAHVYVRRTGNTMVIAVENTTFPSNLSAIGGIPGLVAQKAELTEAQIMASSSYYKHTLNLAADAPKYARPVRYGYGCGSQNNTKFWNISRPGADLSNFYGSEETLQIAERKRPFDDRLVYGSLAVPSFKMHVLQQMVFYYNVTREDNYGDVFWPNAKPLSANSSYVHPAPFEAHIETPADSSRWWVGKLRFKVTVSGTFIFSTSLSSNTSDSKVGLYLTSGSRQIVTWGGSLHIAIEPGVYNLVMVVQAPEASPGKPNGISFTGTFAGTEILNSKTTPVKALSLFGGVSMEYPVNNSDVPHAIKFNYQRPAGTSLAVYADVRKGQVRNQITNGDSNILPSWSYDSNGNLSGVYVESVVNGNVINDDIYVVVPAVSGDYTTIDYQLRVTKN